ncbi:agenet domain-containing protein [Tanacetum coccineum]
MLNQGVRRRMKKEGLVKFEVGQEAELKSFLTGYRGAWFKFKIIDIFWKQNKIKLKYLNYDDGSISDIYKLEADSLSLSLPQSLCYGRVTYLVGIQTEKIYDVPPYFRRLNASNKQLMIRPCYPRMYDKNTVPSVISEVCVVTNGPWKVEDLVDSFDEGCFWSGRVTKVLSEDKVQIEYPLPPAGEGKEDETYDAFCKDLRPTLVWSQEEGWILPTMDGRTAGDAQLIFPSQQGTDSEKEEIDDAAVVGDSPLDAYGTGTSNGTGTSLDSLVEGETEIQNSEAMDAAVCEDVKTDDLESIDRISIMGVQESNAAAAAAAFEKGIDYTINLNIMHEETLEAPILDLEELTNKVKWLKRILHSHQPPSTYSEREEANDAEQVGDSPLDAYGTGTSNDTRISLDSLVEGETEMQSSEAMDVAVCEDVKMDDLESIDSISIIGVQESNAAAAFEKGIDYIVDLNIMHEETPEAPILDLEELANKIRWIKSILHSHQSPSTDSEKEEVDDAEAVGDSPLDAYGNGTSNGTGISLDSLVEGETKIQKAMDAAVCKDVKMDDLESVESNAAATAAAFEEGIEYRIDLNIMHEETREAPIVDLEELANKVRWLKRILHSHQPPSNDTTPWKFS